LRVLGFEQCVDRFIGWEDATGVRLGLRKDNAEDAIHRFGLDGELAQAAVSPFQQGAVVHAELRIGHGVLVDDRRLGRLILVSIDGHAIGRCDNLGGGWTLEIASRDPRFDG